jgi:hypothetical protein
MKTLSVAVFALFLALLFSQSAYADSEFVNIDPVTWNACGVPGCPTNTFTFSGSYFEDSVTALIDPTSLNVTGGGISTGWSVTNLGSIGSANFTNPGVPYMVQIDPGDFGPNAPDLRIPGTYHVEFFLGNYVSTGVVNVYTISKRVSVDHSIGVPEPSSALMLFYGLTAGAVWAYKSRRRSPLQISRYQS